MGPRRWAVGWSSGMWIHRRFAPLNEQAQVLVGNVCAVLARLEASRARSWLAEVPSPPAYSRGGVSWQLTLAARLLGCAVEYIADTFTKLRQNRWIPAAPVGGTCKRRQRKEAEKSTAQEMAVASFRILVREALGNAFQGHSDKSYVRSVSRLLLANVSIGQKYQNLSLIHI